LEVAIKTVHIGLDVLLLEVGLVRLNAEMLVDLLLLQVEESSDLFQAGVLQESFGILQLGAMLGVVPH